jgi:hypothetical protein
MQKIKSSRQRGKTILVVMSSTTSFDCPYPSSTVTAMVAVVSNNK